MGSDTTETGKKTYVLDTNVLVHDPECLFKFEEHDIVIPLACIAEMDKFKREMSERGSGAREASRRIDALRLKARGSGTSLHQGVEIGNASTGKLYVFTDQVDTSKRGIPLRGENAVDNLCIAITERLIEEGKDAVLVSKDLNVRITADSFDIPCDDYRHDKKGHTLDYLFKQGGPREVTVPSRLINDFYSSSAEIQLEIESGVLPEDILLNQGLVMKSDTNPSQSALARYIGNNRIRKLCSAFDKPVASVKPKNAEQKFALDALLSPDIRVVAMLGKAGTGKTLLSLAAGVQQALKEGKYRKMMVVRPTVVIGKDLGYLPGSLEEKEFPYMGPIFDNLSIIFDYGKKDPERWDEESYMEPLRQGHIELRTPIYLRGRSIPRVYIVVDDSQNLTPHEVKLLVTRPSQGSKIVLSGDPWQRDNPYIDEESNGLTTLVRTLMGQLNYFSAEFLFKSERDDMTDELADLL
ncbi:PhoH family protein [Candidatus Woesearchaeota archaeon]|nr:PhoH family protein [Candidatus Woesearchaeota archaeon]